MRNERISQLRKRYETVPDGAMFYQSVAQLDAVSVGELRDLLDAMEDFNLQRSDPLRWIARGLRAENVLGPPPGEEAADR